MFVPTMDGGGLLQLIVILFGLRPSLEVSVTNDCGTLRCDEPVVVGRNASFYFEPANATNLEDAVEWFTFREEGWNPIVNPRYSSSNFSLSVNATAHDHGKEIRAHYGGCISMPIKLNLKDDCGTLRYDEPAVEGRLVTLYFELASNSTISDDAVEWFMLETGSWNLITNPRYHSSNFSLVVHTTAQDNGNWIIAQYGACHSRPIQISLKLRPDAPVFQEIQTLSDCDNCLVGTLGQQMQIQCRVSGGTEPLEVRIYVGNESMTTSLEASGLYTTIVNATEQIHMADVNCSVTNIALDNPLNAVSKIYVVVKPNAPVFQDTQTLPDCDNCLVGTLGQQMQIQCRVSGGTEPLEVRIDVPNGSMTTSLEASGLHTASVNVTEQIHMAEVKCSVSNIALDTPLVGVSKIYVVVKPNAPVFQDTQTLPGCDDCLVGTLGQQMQIQCRVSGGTEPLEVRIDVANESMTTSLEASGLHTASVNVTEQIHMAQVKCSVSNIALGTPLVGGSKIYVVVKPNAPVFQDTQTLPGCDDCLVGTLGQQMQIQCRVSGGTEPLEVRIDVANESMTTSLEASGLHTASVNVTEQIHMAQVKCSVSNIALGTPLVGGSKIYVVVKPNAPVFQDTQTLPGCDDCLVGTLGQQMQIQCRVSGGTEPLEVRIDVANESMTTSLEASGLQAVIVNVTEQIHMAQVKCSVSNIALDTPLVARSKAYVAVKPHRFLFPETDAKSDMPSTFPSCTSRGARPHSNVRLRILNVNNGTVETNTSTVTEDGKYTTTARALSMKQAWNGKTIECCVDHITYSQAFCQTDTLVYKFPPKAVILPGSANHTDLTPSYEYTVACTILRAFPACDVIWTLPYHTTKLNETTVYTNDIVGVTTTVSITLNVSKRDNGKNIMCTASCADFKINVTAVHEVRVPVLTFNLSSTDLYITEGESIVVECSAPWALSAQWLDNSSETGGAVHVHDCGCNSSKSCLRLENVNKQHGGRYTCAAHDSRFNVTEYIKVVVQDTPTVSFNTTSEISMSVGDSRVIRCSANWRASVVQWLDRDCVATMTVRDCGYREDWVYRRASCLWLDNIQAHHGGRYTCMAVYARRNVTDYIHVTVEGTDVDQSSLGADSTSDFRAATIVLSCLLALGLAIALVLLRRHTIMGVLTRNRAPNGPRKVSGGSFERHTMRGLRGGESGGGIQTDAETMGSEFSRAHTHFGLGHHGYENVELDDKNARINVR